LKFDFFDASSVVHVVSLAMLMIGMVLQPHKKQIAKNKNNLLHMA
jgi:hypothetical protein